MGVGAESKMTAGQSYETDKPDTPPPGGIARVSDACDCCVSPFAYPASSGQITIASPTVATAQMIVRTTRTPAA